MSDECSHCALPLGWRPVTALVDGARVWVCCYGCLLALQITRARGEEGLAAAIVVRLGLAVFFTINVMMVSVPTYVPYVYGGGAVANDGPLFDVLRVLALFLAAPVLLLLGVPLLTSAWGGLRAGAANADGLVVLGTFAAYGVSVANTLAGRPEVYFDTATMLLVLVTLGRYLEASAKAEAGAAVRSTLAPGPARAQRIRDERIESISPDDLAPGDIVEVQPGGAFPTDGVVVEGIGGVDEAALSGESRAILKEAGAPVASGTCSIDGLFRVRVTARASESAAARIGALLAAARRGRADIERVADRAAGVLVPGVVVIAIGTALVWTWAEGIGRGVLVGLSVLVVACPCAFGIATPVAIWTGLVVAARRGVVLRSAAVMERVAGVRRVLFDKTGTLTTRTPRLVAVEVTCPAVDSEDEVVGQAAALERGLTHPLARGIVAAWQGRGAAGPAPRVSGTRLVPGRGVRGYVDGVAVAVGNRGFAVGEIGAEDGIPPDDDAGGSRVYVVADGRLRGILHLGEEVRGQAAGAVRDLRRLGLRVGLLSGDGHAGAIVPGIVPATEAVLDLLPAGKVAEVEAARRSSGGGGVAMVGDGINDAPALAAADLGIAVADATDVARVTADVAILSDDLGAVPWIVSHARQVMRVARQNLAWAVAYNVGAIAVAASGALNPLVAALAMLGSSLAVVANARRLRTG